jgi:hypothetical protein
MSRATRKHNGINLINQFIGGEQIGFTTAGGAAHNMNGGGKWGVTSDYRDARFQRIIAGASHHKAVNICDQIAWAAPN